MRALITAPSRSPPGREKGKNERGKRKLTPCLPGTRTAGKDAAESLLRGTDPPQAAQEPFCCSIAASGAGQQQDKPLIDVRL